MPEQKENVINDSTNLECFVIMPMTDPDGYLPGHFNHVYEDIISPACKLAGFKALLGSEVKQTNLIHLDILQRLLNTPMAVCDLSTRNPNVLFELALRQAFDKPVALIQEIGTISIFDIAPLRHTEYHRERIYHDVLEDQKMISVSIKDTYEANKSNSGVNSIVKLLALSKPAEIPEFNHNEESVNFQKIILSEISSLRHEFNLLKTNIRENETPLSSPNKIFQFEFDRKFELNRQVIFIINELERSKEKIENHLLNGEFDQAYKEIVNAKTILFSATIKYPNNEEMPENLEQYKNYFEKKGDLLRSIINSNSEKKKHLKSEKNPIY